MRRMADPYPVPALKYQAIMVLTRRCPLRCAHCIVDAGPEHPEVMDEDLALAAVQGLGRYPQLKQVVFTGGEPFQHVDMLGTLLASAGKWGLETNIVTSAFWASTPRRAREMLDRLPPVTALTFSADRYHLDFISLRHVRNGAQAALERGIRVGAFLCVQGEDDPFLKEFSRAMGERLMGHMRLQTQSLHGAGRARLSSGLLDKIARVPLADVPDKRCTLPAAPAILPDGRMMACCGDTVSDPHRWGALTYGSLKETPVERMLDKVDRHYLVHALRLFGPKRLAIIAQQAAGAGLFDREFERDNICDLCREITQNPRVWPYLRAYLEDPAHRAELDLLRMLQFGETSNTGHWQQSAGQQQVAEHEP